MEKPFMGALHQEERFLWGWTFQSQGDVKDEGVRRSVLSALGYPPESLVTCKQVHSDKVERVRDLSRPVFPEADGLMTDQSDIVLGVFAADCMPVILLDSEKSAAAIVHAGWRGMQKAIALKAAEKMRETWGTDFSRLRVIAGPHIRDCCYSVGADVASVFPQSAARSSEGKLFLSLEKALRVQMKKAGITNVVFDPSCTFFDPNFFSYRRDKTEKRMISFVVKK